MLAYNGTAILHDAKLSPHAVKHTLRIDAHDEIPLIVGRVHDRVDSDNARPIGASVQLSEFLNRLCDPRVDRGAAAHIDLCGDVR